MHGEERGENVREGHTQPFLDVIRPLTWPKTPFSAAVTRPLGAFSLAAGVGGRDGRHRVGCIRPQSGQGYPDGGRRRRHLFGAERRRRIWTAFVRRQFVIETVAPPPPRKNVKILPRMRKMKSVE